MSVALFAVTAANVSNAVKLWRSQCGLVDSIGPQIATFHHSASPDFVAEFKLTNHRLGGVFKDWAGNVVKLKELGSPETFRGKLIAEGFVEADEASGSYKTLLSYLGVSYQQG